MIQGLTAHYKESGMLEAILKQDAECIPIIKGHDGVRDRSLAKQLQRSCRYRHQLKCDKYISPDNISFTVVTDVINSWQMITSIPKWDTVVGDLLLRYIFKIEPAMIELFGFPLDTTNYADPELSNNKKFVTKSVVFIKAFDTAVQLLGPDLHPLQEVLFDLGKRHVHMKAQPEFWPIVGEALFLVFEEQLGERFHDDFRTAWTVMYNFLGYNMIQGLLHQYNELEARS
jgi:Globin